jgi:hypothetical protein
MRIPASAQLGVLLFGVVLIVPQPVRAQQAVARAPSVAAEPCSYLRCAVSIAPRWNGLAVVRGPSGSQVTNLNFFWPRDVASSLRGEPAGAVGADSAVAAAVRAVRLRRVGALLTDGGAALVAVAAVGALRAGHVRRQDGILAAGGLGALGVSIPFQFAADGALSRAVWWHNVRFAR